MENQIDLEIFAAWNETRMRENIVDFHAWNLLGLSIEHLRGEGMQS